MLFLIVGADEDSMAFDTIIKNGSVVTATDTYTADIAIANGKITATCRGTFVAVKEGHPAYHRW